MSASIHGDRRRTEGTQPRSSRRLTPRFWAMLMLLLLLYTACTYAINGYKIFVLHRRIADVNAQIQQIRAQNDALRQRIAQLHSDDYIEKTAREELGLIKDGEIPFVVTDPIPEGSSKNSDQQ